MTDASKHRVVYSPRYDITLFGIEKLHPFDSRKYSRSYRILVQRFHNALAPLTLTPRSPVARADLELSHDAAYLDSLETSSSVIAKAVEMWPLKMVPTALLRAKLLAPMKWATQGTIDAAKWAASGGTAVNLGGGYHHAHRDHGEGFCLYADVPIAIEVLRRDGLIATDAAIAIIDVDAHRGNGFESLCRDDPSLHYFDLYNVQAYPGRYPLANPEGHIIGLRAGLEDEGYFRMLQRLDPFLDGIQKPALAFINAGTDVLAGDPVGRLALSRAAVLERDRRIIENLTQRGIPWVLIPSGGYTDESHRLLAETVQWTLERFAGLTAQSK